MPLPLFRLDPHLQRPWIAERLARPAPPAAVGLSDGFRLPGREGHATPAAVLVPLVNRPAGLTVLLTERSRDLPDHPGQISFPGGRIDPGDESAVAAALREAREEVGLPSTAVTILGELSGYETVTGYSVRPIVGWVEPPVEFVPDPREVAKVFEVPLSFVLDPANHLRESRRHDGVLRSYYVLPYPGHRIWGATAEILVELAGVLALRGA